MAERKQDIEGVSVRIAAVVAQKNGNVMIGTPQTFALPDVAQILNLLCHPNRRHKSRNKLILGVRKIFLFVESEIDLMFRKAFIRVSVNEVITLEGGESV